jgi:predicted HicB family RNase H-like nuclease
LRLFSEAAERQHLSLSAWIRVATLHAAARAEAPGAGRRSPKIFGVRGTALQLRLTEDEKRLFSEAAERRELSVSAWIRFAGLRAAKTRPPHQTKFMPLCT